MASDVLRRRCGWVGSVLPILVVLLSAGGARSQSAPATIRYGAPTATPDITTVSVYFAAENGLFKREGLDVQVTRYPGSTTAIRALLAGKVDATSATILVIEPVLEAMARGEVRTLASLGEQFPAIPLSYVVATEKFIKSHRDVLVRFVRAQVEGLRWAQAHPDEAARIAVKYIRETPLPILTDGMREMARMKAYGVDGGISERGIQETQQALKDMGK